MHKVHQLPFDQALSLAEEEVRRSLPVRGEVRVITIDGPAGAGKSTMAASLSERLNKAPIVHMDDLYRGWQDALTPQLTSVLKDHILTPISLGKVGGYRRWDWLRNTPGEALAVPRHEYLILEGVGASQRVVRPFASTMIWISIDAATGMERVIERDSKRVADPEDFIRQMQAWQGLELMHFERESTFDASHLRCDGARFS